MDWPVRCQRKGHLFNDVVIFCGQQCVVKQDVGFGPYLERHGRPYLVQMHEEVRVVGCVRTFKKNDK